MGGAPRPSGPRRVVAQLDLQRREKALDDGVVAIAPAPHTADDPMLRQQKLVVAAAILTVAIRMMQQARGRAEVEPVSRVITQCSPGVVIENSPPPG